MKQTDYLVEREMIETNVACKTIRLVVKNTGNRPIQVGSHFHFYVIHNALQFDRHATVGMHLNIPAGTALCFEPGESKEVTLVAYAHSLMSLVRDESYNFFLE